MKNQEKFVILAALLIASGIAFNSTLVLAQTISNPPGHNIQLVGGMLTTPELQLSGMVLIFGLIVVVLQYFLFRHAQNAQIEDIFRYMTITVIVIGTLTLVSARLNNTQIAGATGLFGSIIGYMLGRVRSKGTKKSAGAEKNDGADNPG